MAVYGFDDGNNKRKVYTQEEVISILQEAIAAGSTEGIDTTHAPIPEAVNEFNKGANAKLWIGSTEEYSQLGINANIHVPHVDENKNVYLIDDQDIWNHINEALDNAEARDAKYDEMYERVMQLEAGMPLAVMQVGYVYISVVNISPASVFGGTWQRLKDRFLLAAGDTYTAGTTGGEATHTLTINEMPTHNHSQAYDNSGGYLPASGIAHSIRNDIVNNSFSDRSADYYNNNLLTNEGGSKPHNNMPPYLTVYMWKRIA